MFSEADGLFLASVGCSKQELFDFVDDLMEYGEPDLETVCGVQELRRDYFEQVMLGLRSEHAASMDDLPRKTDALEGIQWLPRLIAKARLKLRGEMPPELMYGCGGDRPFVRRMGTSLPSVPACSSGMKSRNCWTTPKPMNSRCRRSTVSARTP